MIHRLVLHAAKGSSCTRRILLALAYKKLKHEVVWYTPDWTCGSRTQQPASAADGAVNGAQKSSDINVEVGQ